ncbi:MAG TPA: 30S ribosomal protein S16 [Actinomycetales bacterium]|nr:30S ribosomal protein S16 [Actinomycetales bacterium]
MAVKIRLKRLGKIRAPYYRIVVADSRTKRDGRAIEEIGKYDPMREPSLIEIDSERAQYWLGVGAQPSDQVLALLKVTGDWQKYKGLPGAEGTLRVAAPKADRDEIFNSIARKSLEEPKDATTTARGKRSPEAGENVVEHDPSDQPAGSEPTPVPAEAPQTSEDAAKAEA